MSAGARSVYRGVRVARSAALLTLVLTALVAAGCTPRVGVVDSRRVLNESVLALSYQKQLDDQEKALAADLRLLAGQLSPEDLEARRQTHIRELAKTKAELETRLNDRIRQAAAEVARKRRLRLVLMKDVTRVGGIDITDDVIERLK